MENTIDGMDLVLDKTRSKTREKIESKRKELRASLRSDGETNEDFEKFERVAQELKGAMESGERAPSKVREMSKSLSRATLASRETETDWDDDEESIVTTNNLFLNGDETIEEPTTETRVREELTEKGADLNSTIKRSCAKCPQQIVLQEQNHSRQYKHTRDQRTETREQRLEILIRPTINSLTGYGE